MLNGRRPWLQVFAPGGRQATKKLALRFTDCVPALLRRALGPSPQWAVAQGGAAPTEVFVFDSIVTVLRVWGVSATQEIILLPYNVRRSCHYSVVACLNIPLSFMYRHATVLRSFHHLRISGPAGAFFASFAPFHSAYGALSRHPPVMFFISRFIITTCN
jgi:hypothetical protein